VLISLSAISAELHFILLSPWFCKWPLRRLRHASPNPFFNYRSPSRTNFCSAEHRLLHLFREHKALFRSFLSCLPSRWGRSCALAPAKYALSVINTRQLLMLSFRLFLSVVRAPSSQIHRFARQTRQGDQPQCANILHHHKTYFFEIYAPTLHKK
jgi:hypothetical protein